MRYFLIEREKNIGSTSSLILSRLVYASLGISICFGPNQHEHTTQYHAATRQTCKCNEFVFDSICANRATVVDTRQWNSHR